MFVTIGHSPRPDIVPELVSAVRTALTPHEIGVLDGLDEQQIAGMSAGSKSACLVTRLRDGRAVVLDRTAVEDRLEALLGEIDRQKFDLIVPLCGGHFRQFRLETPFIEPEHVVNFFPQGLAYGMQQVGILLPHRQQIADYPPFSSVAEKFAVVSPYEEDREAKFRAAGAALGDTGLIVMNCMGYTEAMRRNVADAAKRPVLLLRRLTAHAIDLMLS